jgi:alpha-D-ribose 1-methylphosphonate 5-triphosphate synthase subunit PhnH
MTPHAPVSPGAARAGTDATTRDPVRASQHVFRVTLDALGNPGSVQHLIVHPRLLAEDAIVNPYVASVLLTLLDHEVTLHVAPGPDAPGLAGLADLMVRRTRTTLVDAGSADFAVATSASLEPGLPETLRRGSLEYPDDGATLVVDVPSLDQAEAGSLELTLAGPGIESVRRLRLAGLPAAFFHARNRAVAHYPTGIDVVLIDRTGRLVGLPRTTGISIYAEGTR